MENQSTSTLTLMFTDIEGSTALLRAAGDRYADLLDRHRAIIRSAVADHDGIERDTQGDSFFMTFHNPSAALAAALTAQRLLFNEPWPDGLAPRVRIGLHLGEATETREGPVGLAVHQAARIAASAHGGQIVLSDVVRLATAQLPPDTSVTSLGQFRIRDVGWQRQSGRRRRHRLAVGRSLSAPAVDVPRRHQPLPNARDHARVRA